MPAKHSELRTSQSAILLAVTGLSPAIVTETIWALSSERPRVIPGRVIFITTKVGAQRIRDQLFTPLAGLGGVTAWQALRAAVKAGEDELIAEPPRVIGKADRKKGTLEPLPDIVTPADNEIAAGFILEQVRGIVENPETTLIASIAGGRKTMGALLHAAVTLLGRESDRLTHVLVSAPYETLPGFFFPGQPGGPLQDASGRRHHPGKAGVQLATVPFVPLRNRFADLSEMPGSFDGLVRKFSRTIREDAARPRLVEIHYRRKTLSVDGVAVKAPVKALAILHSLLDAQDQGRHLASQQEAIEHFTGWLSTAGFIPAGLKPPVPRDGFPATDIGHDLGELRQRLRKAGVTWEIPRRSLHFPPFNHCIGER